MRAYLNPLSHLSNGERRLGLTAECAWNFVHLRGSYVQKHLWDVSSIFARLIF